MTKDGRAAHPFVRDIEPYFYGRPVTYVDIGAHQGSVFEQLLASSLSVREAHLVEPHPKTFQTLQAAVADVKINNLTCHNVAVSRTPGVVTMRDEGTMTHVATAPSEAAPEGLSMPFFEVKTVTLDELARTCGIERINVLKVDVEGHEVEVLEGAKQLLAAEKIDMIYVEAGMKPEPGQHTYYRSIEDLLTSHGYRLLRIYEQTNEWLQDSPALRRVNLAFLSSSFAEQHPHRLSRELFRLRRQHEKLEEEAAELRGKLESAQDSLEESRGGAAQLKRERNAVRARLAEVEQRAAGLTAQLQARERAVEALTLQRDAFVEYADKLEEKYTKVLASRSWRAMGPARVLIRTVRRSLGRPDAGRNRMPKRPRTNATDELVTSQVASMADQIMKYLRRSDYHSAYQLKQTLERELASVEGYLSHAFLMVTLTRKLSAFGFGAQAADGVLDRYRDRRIELLSTLGESAYRRFVIDASVNYTRIGRYADARELLDAEIEAGLSGLLSTRAEVSWAHDPQQAAADLVNRFGDEVGDPADRNALLLRHLRLNELNEPVTDVPDMPEQGEFPLVDAVRALDDGRTADYRRLVNEFFTAEGRCEVFADSEAEFSFEELRSLTGEQVSDGPLVTVIMTTYNSTATLSYAVRSILEQTHQNIELLIIDDCSTDGTPERLAELAAADDRIRVLHSEENGGTYVARNRVMREARGEYITFHDSDDWAHPERIAVHLAAMAEDPGLLITRSFWIRVEDDGRIDFRRWGKRLVHPNPASVFMRREVLDELGFFDQVRFSADSEYWYRAQRAFGKDGARSIPHCLGLGRHHDGSLTRSGAGARDVEGYSAVRSAYQYSWLEWHARNRTDDLFLPAEPERRAFWAPPEMMALPSMSNEGVTSLAVCYPGLHDVPNFVFGISLASQQVVPDWELTAQLLQRTLRSVLAQTDERWRVVVCGHERPDLDEFDDPRIMFMTADIKPPANSGQFRKDKTWKRRLAGAVLRDLGGGYFCPLDADDLVHKDLVSHVLGDDNRHGYVVSGGYVQDFVNSRLAPVPGAWSAPFDRVCGTSAVLYFDVDELPRDGRFDPDLYFNLFQGHAYWPIVAEEWGRPLGKVPFPGAVYVVNHSQNLSFGLQRAGERTHNVISSIERHATDQGEAILRDDFGQVT